MRRMLCAVTGLLIVLSVVMGAQEKKAAAKEDRISGTVSSLDKNAKTMRVQRGNVFRVVIFDDATKFTFRNKPSSIDDVREGRRVICLGKFNDKSALVASRIDVRDRN